MVVLGILVFSTSATSVLARTREKQWVIREKTIPAAPQAGGKVLRDFLLGIPQPDVSAVRKIDPKNENRVFMYLYGGAYVFNPGKAGLAEAVLIAARCNIRVISVDYRMPPKHPFPAVLDDAVNVYREPLKKHRAGCIALGGTSAGGGLTPATVHKLKALGLDVPAALFAGIPWTDLTKTGDSYYIN
ncbi:MAG: alpha/beta hydrolase fold domain-containing protein [Deltaproteobacteria bacterium]|nr:alpha/beta hydrolase fold domain-containing protein [Deltaproteobacteria bacterium]